jgi:hypothetical protein
MYVYVYVAQVNTQTMHGKSILHNGIAMFSLKNFFPCGIRTQSSVFEADVHCATPPGHTFYEFIPGVDPTVEGCYYATNCLVRFRRNFFSAGSNFGSNSAITLSRCKVL